MRRLPGPSNARPRTTRSSRSARCRRWPISPPTCRRPRRASSSCSAATEIFSIHRFQRREHMTAATNSYLAIFLGSRTSAQWKAWDALSEDERSAKGQQGMAAWKAWVDKYHDAIVTKGGPLGKTRRVDAAGISEISNEMGAFTVVRAASHEDAAKMFEGHPHFAIFPG